MNIFGSFKLLICVFLCIFVEEIEMNLTFAETSFGSKNHSLNAYWIKSANLNIGENNDV